MDNLAHSLLGLVVAKAGLDKFSPGATAVCVLAANAPDIDFVYAISGDRWTLLHHHRGVSHSIAGTLVLGIALPVLFCLIEFAVARSRDRPRRFRFRGLLLASLIACATHPLLDWTNNYGVRPFLPWSGKWFYGDFVFVVDPLVWVILGGAAYLLAANSKLQISLWGLLAAAVTSLMIYVAWTSRALEHPTLVLVGWIVAIILIAWAHRLRAGKTMGRPIALAALLLLCFYWGTLSVLHSQALKSGATQAAKLAGEHQETLLRMAAMPTLASPAHWRFVAETDQAVYRFEVYLDSSAGRSAELVRYSKFTQPENAVRAAALKDRRTQAFMEFARFPVEQLSGDCATQTFVQFADLRYTEPGKTRGSFSLEVPIECPEVDDPSDGR